MSHSTSHHRTGASALHAPVRTGLGEARRRFLLAAAGAGIALVVPIAALAGGRVSGVATEFTQIANYGILGDQLKRAIETASNTLQTVTNLQRQLVGLPAAVLGGVLRDLGVDMKGINRLLRTVSDARSAYANLSDMVDRDMRSMKTLKMSPQEYLNLRLDLAEKKGGVFRAAVESDMAIINTASERAEALEASMKAAAGISTHVQGFQVLASQNAQVMGSLSQLTQTIASEHVARNRERQERLANEQAMNAAVQNAQRNPGQPVRAPGFGAAIDLVAPSAAPTAP